MWAIVMYGTNDLERYDAGTYHGYMSQIIDVIENHATVPILSTIPARTDDGAHAARVQSFNDAVRSLAQARHLPLIDYHYALSSLPNQGVSWDGIHPSIYQVDACVFTHEALQYGYNVRNLTALQMLARLQSY